MTTMLRQKCRPQPTMTRKDAEAALSLRLALNPDDAPNICKRLLDAWLRCEPIPDVVKALKAGATYDEDAAA